MKMWLAFIHWDDYRQPYYISLHSTSKGAENAIVNVIKEELWDETYHSAPMPAELHAELDEGVTLAQWLSNRYDWMVEPLEVQK